MKKNFLFGLLVLMLAGFGFGGVSLADCASPNIACIGDTGYESLRAAIAAADENEETTIKLIADDDVSFKNQDGFRSLVINKAITIDGDSHTIKGIKQSLPWVGGVSADNVNSHAIIIRGDNNVTISNLTISEFGETDYVSKGRVPLYADDSYEGNLSLNNVTIEKFNRDAITIKGGTFNFTNLTINGNPNSNKGANNSTCQFDDNYWGATHLNWLCEQTQQGIQIYGASGEMNNVTITNITNNGSTWQTWTKNDSTKGVEFWNGYAVLAWNGANVTIKNSNLSTNNLAGDFSAGVYSDNATVSLQNTAVTVNNTVTQGQMMVAGTYSPVEYEDVLINDGQGEAALEAINGGVINVSGEGEFKGINVVDQGSTITIVGGTFSVDPNEYLGDDYCSFPTAGGKFEVNECPASVNFQMSINKDVDGNPITVPVVLNDAGNGLIKDDTIVVLKKAGMTAGDFYTAFSVLTQDQLTAAAKVVEVEGQKLLFFAKLTEIGVFTEEKDGGVFSSRDKFIIAEESNPKDYDMDNPPVAYDSENKVDPFEVSAGTINKYHEISKDGKVIGYTFHIEGGKWFYAPAKYNVTFVDVDGTTELKEATAYAYGTMAADITLPENLPTKAADSTCNTYELGWTPALADVTADVTYKAKFTCTSKKTSSYSGGGGSSKKTETTKEEDAKANTGDTAKLDDTKANENTNEENKNEGSNTDGATASAEEFSQEFKDAYEFAHKNGITTKDSIEEAEMYAPLTRIAMAKMLSQYAINVLGKTPDTTKVVPTFPDVSAQLDADYDNGVTLAYQLGIMGIGIEEFRPFAEVTRAEFGTALSRMLFGTADGEGADWYKTHLDKLMNEQIITNDNPNLKELRGYVMIMLMRSAQ